MIGRHLLTVDAVSGGDKSGDKSNLSPKGRCLCADYGIGGKGAEVAKLTGGKSGTIAKAEIPEKGQRFIFDDHRDAPRGFGLRITAAGGKAFILKYTFDGRQRRMTIGDWPTWSLEAARDEGRALCQQIDNGIDPLDKARRRKAEPSVAEVVKQYIKSHVSGLTSEKAIIRYFERDLLTTLGRLKVQDLTRRDLIELVEAKATETPTAARHLLAYVKGLLDWCVDREYLAVSPAAGIRPRSITPQGRKNALKPNKRKRVLDHEEILSFWNSAESCGIHPLTAMALKLVLLTGQWPGEVAGMRANEISGNTWIIPAERRMKTETEQRVPLTAEAQAIIERAQNEVQRLSARRKQEGSGFIFEARPGMAISVGALSKAVARYGGWRPLLSAQ